MLVTVQVQYDTAIDTRHCEQQSDAVTQRLISMFLDCFAALATTGATKNMSSRANNREIPILFRFIVLSSINPIISYITIYIIFIFTWSHHSVNFKERRSV